MKMFFLMFLTPGTVVLAGLSLFFAILFLQSGLDKLVDYKGNLAYFKSHFEHSILKPFVPILTFKITVLEVAAGTSSLIGVGQLLFFQAYDWTFLGQSLSLVSLLSLFLGQRLAKDYAGAASLAAYVVVNALSLGLLHFIAAY